MIESIKKFHQTYKDSSNLVGAANDMLPLLKTISDNAKKDVFDFSNELAFGDVLALGDTPTEDELKEKEKEIDAKIQVIQDWDKVFYWFFRLYHLLKNNALLKSFRGLKNLQEFNDDFVKFQEAITADLEKKEEELIKIKKQVNSQLTLFLKSQKLKAKELLGAEKKMTQLTLPKKYVEVRFWVRKGQKKNSIAGFDSTGHVSIEVCNGSKSAYVSLVTTREYLEEEESFINDLLKATHLPSKSTFKGRFLGKEEERKRCDEGIYEKESPSVILDCSKPGGALNIDAMYDFASGLLEEYDNSSKDSFQKYPYQFYFNNCAKIVADVLAAGGADIKSDPLLKPIGDFFMPVKVFNFAVQMGTEIHLDQLSSEIEKVEIKALEKKWHNAVNFFVGQISQLDNKLLEFKCTRLDAYEVNLPDKEKLETIKQYALNDIDEIIKITQALSYAFTQPVSGKKSKDAFFKTLQIVKETLLSFDLNGNSECSEKGKKFLQFILNFQKQYGLENLKNEIQCTNDKCIEKLYNLLGSTSLKEHTLNAVAADFEKEITYHELLFRSRGLHKVCGDWGKGALKNTEEHLAPQHPTEEVELFQASKKVTESLFTLEAEMLSKNTSGESEKLDYSQAKKIIELCLTSLVPLEKITEDPGQFFFQQEMSVRELLRKLYGLWEEEKKRLAESGKMIFPEEMYQGVIQLMRAYLGTLRCKSYFDLDFSHDRKDTSNLLLKMADLIYSGRPEIDDASLREHGSVKLFIEEAKSALLKHSNTQFSQISEALYEKNKDETLVDKPSVFAFWQWNKRHQLFELETMNQASVLLQKEEEGMLKYVKIQRFLESRMPSRYQFWRREERQRYLALANKLGLVCLMENFISGRGHEAQLLVFLEKHRAKYGLGDANLSCFIKAIREKNHVLLEKNNQQLPEVFKENLGYLSKKEQVLEKQETSKEQHETAFSQKKEHRFSVGKNFAGLFGYRKARLSPEKNDVIKEQEKYVHYLLKGV